MGSPVCTLRGKGAAFEFAALCHLLHTTGLLPSVQHMGFPQEVPRPVFRPGREAAEALQLSPPSTLISHGKAIPSSVREKRSGTRWHIGTFG